MTTSSKIRKFKHTFHNAALNSAPQPPSEIQTSLLQVGMRVRKAMSQGYRTQWALEEQKLQSHRLRYKKQDTIITLWEEQPRKADNDDTNTLSSSQESAASEVSSLLTATSSQHPVLQLRTKRGYTQEEDDAQAEGRMDAISTHLRPIAQAISRRRVVNAKPAKIFDGTATELEFEDAVFLDPRNQDRVNRYVFEELT